MQYKIREIKSEELMRDDFTPSPLYKSMTQIFEEQQRGQIPAKKLYHRAKKGLVLGAFNQDRLIGYLAGNVEIDFFDGKFQEKPYVYAEELAVDKQYENNGLAINLLNSLKESARKKDIFEMKFVFDLKNPHLAYLYVNKLGAKVTRYDPFMYGSGRAIVDIELGHNKEWEERKPLNEPKNLEEYEGEIFENIDEYQKQKLLDDFAVNIFDEKLGKLNKFFSEVINDKLCVLTDVYREDNKVYYRFQTYENIFKKQWKSLDSAKPSELLYLTLPVPRLEDSEERWKRFDEFLAFKEKLTANI